MSDAARNVDTSGADAVTVPALAVRDLVVNQSVVDDIPATPHATRDLPDLARFLFFALGAERQRDVKVLDGVRFDVAVAESVAIVGEGGCGKSTLARTCARRIRPSRGTVALAGIDVHRARRAKGLAVRRGLQVLFDDDEAGLDPRLRVRESLMIAAAALRLPDRATAVDAALAKARVGSVVVDTRAGALSAGDRHRAALARALLSEPSVLVIDEPAGGLDPTERAVLLETLVALRGHVSLLVLTADLAAARALADRIGVLHKGALVEIDRAEKIFAAPAHPYTQALVAAAPRVHR